MSGERRILIIEDNEEMRSLLEDFFEEEGCLADSIEKGTYAFARLMRDSFDLIVTDIRMPGFSGLDILPGLKKLQPETPIIVITAFGGEEIHRKALERGATAYLEKPIHFQAFRELIHDLLPQKENKPGGRKNGRDSNHLSRKIG